MDTLIASTTLKTNYEYKPINSLYELFMDYTDVKSTTLTNYTTYLKRFVIWLSEKGITQPTREDIKAYKEYLDSTSFTAGTRQQYLRIVKHFFNWLSCEGLYPNVAAGIKTAKVKADNTKKESFTKEDIKVILDNIDTSTEIGARNYCIILLSVTCALRINEMRLANIGDIQTIRGNKVIYIQGKGHDSKDTFKKICPEVYQDIQTYLSFRTKKDKTDPLFVGKSTNNKEDRLTKQSISRLIKTEFRKAGFDSSKLTAHSLRHTSNTLLFESGADLYTVQHHARHENPVTTEIYIHAVEDQKAHTEQDIYNVIYNKAVNRRDVATSILNRLDNDKLELAISFLQAL